MSRKYKAISDKDHDGQFCSGWEKSIKYNKFRVKGIDIMGYARILKDNNGKPSGYRECDGEVAFMPEQQSYENIFRRVKIDIDTMEILNHDYIKDKQHVYRRGVLLRGITPEGFHVYNGVYTGNHQVIYTPYGDAKIAHPASFEALDDGISYGKQFPYSYGRDEEFVYFFTSSTDTKHAVRLKACHDPQAFSVLSEKFAKDDKHVYREEQILKKADPATFEVLKDHYARDDRHVFFVNRIIEADVTTFIVLEDGYAKDDSHLFYLGNIAPEQL